MEEIVGEIIEAGIDVVEVGVGSDNKGCLIFSIILVLIAVGVALYFVYK